MAVDTQEHTGVAIMAFVSEADANRLAVPGGEDPSKLHVTLDYLAELAVDVGPFESVMLNGVVRSLAHKYLPLTVDIFAAAKFNYNNAADDERPPCTVLLVQSQELVDLHDNVQSAITFVPNVSSANSFPLWIPHITLGYNIDPAKLPDVTQVTLDRIGIGYGDEIVFV